MKRRTRLSLQTQKGQALTEFLVVSFALVPLFLLIPIIAKYQDINNATQLASRYVAFEAITRNYAVSSWKPENQLANEIRRRFFSNRDAPIKTADGDAAGDYTANQNLFWRDPKGNPLIKDFNDVTVSFGSDNKPSHDGAFSSASDGKPFSVHDQLGLQARGIYTANVSVKLANLPAGLKFYEPFDKINLSMTRRTSIVIDPWTAKDPGQVDTRVGGNAAIFPAGQLQAVAQGIDAAVAVIDLGQTGPKLGRLDFWTDVVPEDRLKSNAK